MTSQDRHSTLASRHWTLLTAGALCALGVALLIAAIAARPAGAVPIDPPRASGQSFPTFEVEGEDEEESEDEDEEVEDEEEGEGEEFGTEGPLLFPSECLLHTAEAQVTALSSHDVVRLTIHYTSYAATNVAVDYWLKGGKGSLQLEGAKRHFTQQGVFQQTDHLSDREMAKVRAARAFIVQLGISGAPSYCNQYSTQRLTTKHTAGERATWSRQG